MAARAALVHAAMAGDLAELSRRLDEGADPNASAPVTDPIDDFQRGTTALIAAAEEGQLEAVGLLLDCGAVQRATADVKRPPSHEPRSAAETHASAVSACVSAAEFLFRAFDFE